MLRDGGIIDGIGVPVVAGSQPVVCVSCGADRFLSNGAAYKGVLNRSYRKYLRRNQRLIAKVKRQM